MVISHSLSSDTFRKIPSSMLFFHVWLVGYCMVHLMLRCGSDAAAFAKYGGRTAGEEVAGRVYKAKSGFVLLLLVAQAWMGLPFHTSAVLSFSVYSLEMLVRTGFSRATVLYSAASAGLVAEWVVTRAAAVS